MKTRDLIRLGIPAGACAEAAQQVLEHAGAAGHRRRAIVDALPAVAAAPDAYLDDPTYGAVARLLVSHAAARQRFAPRASDAPFRVWGTAHEDDALRQIRDACRLPVAVAGALMPDAHVGYGLPIGGVLATDDAVIPYAVGVDIACRMKLTVVDLPADAVTSDRSRLARALERETRFGIGASFQKRRQHEVMDADWRVSPVTAATRDKAWAQLGTSGSGNHFVEFGHLTVLDPSVGLPAGTYLALLSHSGSRGAGAQVADFYSKLARSRHPELPQELGRLAWLDLASEEGQQYWAAMELMGEYAAANHALIHRHVAAALGAEVLLDIENHHNFAWRERHRRADGTEADVIVHRKGATPAGAGTIGVIPGSMATPGYVVRGKGGAGSLDSASHGAGRRMSRTRAKQQYRWAEVNAFLRERGVTLISAGLDEVPMAYKDIDAVMAAQQDLVEVLARFDPRLVKMAPGGEPAED